MHIETVSSRNDETQRVQLTAEVDVGVIPYGFATRRQWRPTLMYVTWSRFRVNAGPWTEWVPEHVSWSGMTVRIDGTDGVPRSERVYLHELVARQDGQALAVVLDWLGGTVPGDSLPAPLPAQVG